jgi:hypothetical protein
MTAVVDMTGQTFGRLTALRQVPCPIKYTSDGYRRNAWWECKCSCGNMTTRTGRSLRHGTVLSCGSSVHERAGTDRTSLGVDLTGRTFGFLTVQSRGRPLNYDSLSYDHRKRNWWLCRCICGTVKAVAAHHLINGHTTSCGCKGRNYKPLLMAA